LAARAAPREQDNYLGLPEDIQSILDDFHLFLGIGQRGEVRLGGPNPEQRDRRWPSGAGRVAGRVWCKEGRALQEDRGRSFHSTGRSQAPRLAHEAP